MRKNSLLFLFSVLTVALILSLSGSGCGKKDNSLSADGMGNNLVKIIPFKIASEPLISFKFLFHTGSMDDPQGKNGLAYLASQLLGEGGTQKNSYQAILKKLYPLASGYNVRVDREYITFAGTTHIDNLKSFYTLFKEALLEPGFFEEDFQRIKSENINFLKNTLRYSSDEELGRAVFKAFVYSGTPYEKNIRGIVSDLEKITVDDVKKFYKANFTRDNLIVGLSGNFPDTILKDISADFGKLPASENPTKPAAAPGAIPGIKVLIVEKPGDSTGIHMGFPIPLMRKDPDFHALFLANSWMGEHRNSSSHLYQVIREARGMNYGDYSYIEDFPEGGRRSFPPTNIYKNPQVFEIWIRPVENDKRLFALRAALRELKSVVDNGLSKEGFELTRKFLAKYYLNFAASNEQRLGYKIDDTIYGLNESYLDNFRKNIDALTLEKVNLAIKKYWQYNNIKIVFVTSDAEKLKNDLINNVPSPITYRTPKPDEVLKEDKLIEVFPLKVKAEDITIIKVDEVFQ